MPEPTIRTINPTKAQFKGTHVYAPGDLVVCIDDQWDEGLFSSGPPADFPWLKEGKLYRIEWTGIVQTSTEVLFLVNVTDDPDWFFYQHAWTAEMFRPLNEGHDAETIHRIKSAKPRNKLPAVLPKTMEPA